MFETRYGNGQDLIWTTYRDVSRRRFGHSGSFGKYFFTAFGNAVEFVRFCAVPTSSGFLYFCGEMCLSQHCPTEGLCFHINVG